MQIDETQSSDSYRIGCIFCYVYAPGTVNLSETDISMLLKCQTSFSIKFSIVCVNQSLLFTSLFISALHLNLMLLGKRCRGPSLKPLRIVYRLG